MSKLLSYSPPMSFMHARVSETTSLAVEHKKTTALMVSVIVMLQIQTFDFGLTGVAFVMFNAGACTYTVFPYMCVCVILLRGGVACVRKLCMFSPHSLRLNHYVKSRCFLSVDLMQLCFSHCRLQGHFEKKVYPVM